MAYHVPVCLSAEKPGGLIVVDELQAGGHAQAAGVTVGDVLLAVTARSQVRTAISPRHKALAVLP